MMKSSLSAQRIAFIFTLFATVALHAQTTATIVELDRDRRISAIRFKRWDGSEGVASGKVFVLAAHGIEIPRLLLNSRSEARPNGVRTAPTRLAAISWTTRCN